MKIKALSLWEPWATLMRLGAKTIETRSWPTSYRGPLLICAAKRLSLSELQYFACAPQAEPFRLALSVEYGALGALKKKLYPGMAVAVVDLEDCGRTTGPRAITPGEWEEAFGDFSPGRYAWITTNLRAIEPFPVRGRQGLFEVELPEGVEP